MGSLIEIQDIGKIQYDFESAKASIQQRVDEYSNVVFTEDTKKDAKQTVADLRKEQKAFSDRVKEVKAEWMKPFDDFYSKAKELMQMYDLPIGQINEQIEAFENKRKEEKKEQIESIFGEIIDDMQDLLPLSKIYNPKWENATVNPTQIRKEMMTIKMDTIKALKTIEETDSDIVDKAKQFYLDTFDLAETLSMITSHEKQKKEILSKHKEEAKKEAYEEVMDQLIPDLEGETNLYEYRMSLTADAKQKLEMYLDSIGIEWEEM